MHCDGGHGERFVASPEATRPPDKRRSSIGFPAEATSTTRNGPAELKGHGIVCDSQVSEGLSVNTWYHFQSVKH